ncbi:hypothetical protein MSPP1_002446 [Malassezia sp. CBS 17886]|nr:hypothetical protein MSPP1_002446 [Malassezia sp. CBS 17886]
MGSPRALPNAPQPIAIGAPDGGACMWSGQHMEPRAAPGRAAPTTDDMRREQTPSQRGTAQPPEPPQAPVPPRPALKPPRPAPFERTRSDAALLQRDAEPLLREGGMPPRHGTDMPPPPPPKLPAEGAAGVPPPPTLAIATQAEPGAFGTLFSPTDTAPATPLAGPPGTMHSASLRSVPISRNGSDMGGEGDKPYTPGTFMFEDAVRARFSPATESAMPLRGPPVTESAMPLRGPPVTESAMPPRGPPATEPATPLRGPSHTPSSSVSTMDLQPLSASLPVGRPSEGGDAGGGSRRRRGDTAQRAVPTGSDAAPRVMRGAAHGSDAPRVDPPTSLRGVPVFQQGVPMGKSSSHLGIPAASPPLHPGPTTPSPTLHPGAPVPSSSRVPGIPLLPPSQPGILVSGPPTPAGAAMPPSPTYFGTAMRSPPAIAMPSPSAPPLPFPGIPMPSPPALPGIPMPSPPAFPSVPTSLPAAHAPRTHDMGMPSRAGSSAPHAAPALPPGGAMLDPALSPSAASSAGAASERQAAAEPTELRTESSLSSDEDVDVDETEWATQSEVRTAEPSWATSTGVAAGDITPKPVYATRFPPVFEPRREIVARASVNASALFQHTLALATGEKLRLFTLHPTTGSTVERVVAQAAELYAELGQPPSQSQSSRELRTSHLAFCPPVARAAPDAPDPGAPPPPPPRQGRFLWYGTPSGTLAEIDTETLELTGLCTSIHKAPICLLARVGRAMVSMDESGKISSWVPRADGPFRLATAHPHSQRITLPRYTYVAMLGDQLWTCTMAAAPKAAPRTPHVRMYNPLADDRPFNAVSAPAHMAPALQSGVGAVTCSAVLAARPDNVFFGHDSGHVSVWSRAHAECVAVQQVVWQPVVALVGVCDALWAATRSGHIFVFDVDATPWRTVKTWRAHRDAVTALLCDPYGVQPTTRALPVYSVGADGVVHVWDGFLSLDWLDAELAKNAQLFVTYRALRVLELTYNIGAAHPSDMFGLVDNMELFQRVLRSSCTHAAAPDSASADGEPGSPDVIVFALQEVIDLEDKRLTAKRLLLGNKKREGADFDYRFSNQYRAWHDKLVGFVRLVMPPEAPYTVLLSHSMVGLFTCVFVKTAMLPRVRDSSIYTVKTGLGGRYGNKGAIISRFVVDDASFCFLNCHLAAGQRHVRQRNANISGIMQSVSSKTLPRPRDVAYVNGGDGTMVLDHEFCFVAGDLNCASLRAAHPLTTDRLDMDRDHVFALVKQQQYEELCGGDQLLAQLRGNEHFALHAFQEAPIHFPPTYKFNRFSNDWDSSEKVRVPAYCDRVLWYAHQAGLVQCTSYRRWDATLSDHRPVSATFDTRAKTILHDVRAQVLQRKTAELDKHKETALAELRAYHQSL